MNQLTAAYDSVYCCHYATGRIDHNFDVNGIAYVNEGFSKTLWLGMLEISLQRRVESVQDVLIVSKYLGLVPRFLALLQYQAKLGTNTLA